jgi:hypothetical protein
MTTMSYSGHRSVGPLPLRILGIILVCAAWQAWPQAASIVEEAGPTTRPDLASSIHLQSRPADSAKVAPPVPSVKLPADVLTPILPAKRTAVIAGNAIFFSGCLIQYALILPQSSALKPTDLEGQLALISPELLATGLRYAGTPISCMRTSEVVAAYCRSTGKPKPKNYAWTLYFSGWGLTVTSGILNAAAIVLAARNGDSRTTRILTNGGQAVAIGADVVWAAANVYSLLFVNKLGAQAAAARIGITPYGDSRGNVGLALDVRF